MRPVNSAIEIGLVVGRPGNDQRRARLVDQDRIDLVDDRVVERALDHRGPLIFHVVAQIVEAELVVGAVGDVRMIGVATLLVGQIGHDHPNGQPEEAVDLPHPARVACGEIVVDGDDMDAGAGQRVEIGGERRDEGLALAGAHLGDLAAVEHDAADQLDVVVALAERALGRLAHRGEGLGEQAVEILAIGQTRAEQGGLVGEIGVVHRRNNGLKAVDLADQTAERLDVTFVGRTEQGLGKAAEHGEFLCHMGSAPPVMGRRRRECERAGGLGRTALLDAQAARIERHGSGDGEDHRDVGVAIGQQGDAA
jgi:hypothetical protein